MAYENLGNLVRFINPHDADPVLKRIDEYLFFGVNPTLWLERWIRPWFSEIMHSCDTSYFPFLPIIGFVLYASRDYPRFLHSPFRGGPMVHLPHSRGLIPTGWRRE
jgi:hypothetical protein